MTGFAVVNEGALEHVSTQPGLIWLDFWQASCAQCWALEPRLERFAARHPGEFQGYRVDVDAQPDAPARYDVMSVPTIVVLRDGREIARLDGLIRETDLEDVLRAASAGA